jgi:hypothetical protein
MFFWRSTAELLGGLDSRLGAGTGLCAAEDIDFIYRGLKAGTGVLVAPDIEVLHWGKRAYGDGSASKLVSGSFLGIGAMYGMHARRGDLMAMGHQAVESSAALAYVCRQIATRRRPIGLRRTHSLLMGFAKGLLAKGA